MSFSEFSSSSLVSIKTLVDRERCLLVHLSPVHLRNWISESCLQNMALSTLLILAICRTCVIFKPRSPQSLCGSVVEHQSAESEGLRFDSSRGLQNFSLFHARDISIYLFTEQKNYHLSYSFQKTFIDLWHVAVFLCGCPFSFRRFENTFLLKLISLHLESEAWSEIKHSAVKILPNDFLKSHTKNMHWCMHFGALTAICDRTELKF